MIHIDTHVALWLAGDEADRLPAVARDAVDNDDVRLSPIAQLELGYLHEIGRITRPAADVIAALASSIALSVSTAPLPAIVAHAMSLTWTRDPFNRLIVATALADQAQLVTTDRVIRANFPGAVWD